MKIKSIRRTHLENGIRIVSERMPDIRSVSLGIWIQAGSADEDDRSNGISHFLEHMLFKGTRNRSAREIAESLERLGGSLNASTGKEITIYSARVLDEHVPIALDVLADLIQNPTLLSKDIALEKNVVLTEINHAIEDPEELAMDLFYKNVFNDHPLGLFIYGTEENVKRFNRTELLQHLQRHYVPERIVVAAAGKVDHEQLVDLVRRYFSASASAPAPILSTPTNGSVPFAAYPMDSLQQAHLVIGGQTMAYNDERKYAMIMLDLLLGGGMSSRLFQNIREKHGVAYSVYSFSDFMLDTGLIGIYLACDQDKTEKSLHLLRKELKRLCKSDLDESEVDLIKSHVRGSLIMAMESNSYRMRKIAENEIYGEDHFTPREILRLLESVSRANLIELAREFLNPDKLTTTLIIPSSYELSLPPGLRN